MLRLSCAPIVVLSLLAACQSGPEPTAEKAPPRASATAATVTPAAATVKPGAATVKLGAPLTGAEVVPLARLATDAKTYAERTVKTEGKVTAVCQAMGCWMEIADSSTQVHIKMRGHSFFVPKTASGRHAVVEGTLLAKPGDGECEKEAEQATGKTVKLELDATGVELL
jgi:hypothetical protein